MIGMTALNPIATNMAARKGRHSLVRNLESTDTVIQPAAMTVICVKVSVMIICLSWREKGRRRREAGTHHEPISPSQIGIIIKAVEDARDEGTPN